MQKHTYTSIQQQQQNRKGSPEQYQTIDGEKGADSVQVITDFQGSSFELTSHLLFASHSNLILPCFFLMLAILEFYSLKILIEKERPYRTTVLPQTSSTLS